MFEFNTATKTLRVLSCTNFYIILCLQEPLTNVFVVVQFLWTKERHFVTRAGISFEFFIKATEEKV